MTVDPETGTTKVDGATIYHEKRGSGPLLLVIPGGPQDAGVFADLARRLADSFTIVAFDPRGNSRSPFDKTPEPLDVATHAEDAATLIRRFSDGPAHVFGTSGGAQIGLDLAARHPDLVATLVAHEPPAAMMLDEPSEVIEQDRRIRTIYREKGVEAAMAAFFEMAGMDDEETPDAGTAPGQGPSPEDAETFARVSGNFEYWLAEGMLALTCYEPDIARLRAGLPRIVVGIGRDSGGTPIEAMGLALARALGSDPVAFPGDHTGYAADAPGFASQLRMAVAGHEPVEA